MKIRFLLMLAFIAIVAVGWTFGWQFLSGKAENVFVKAVETVNQDEVQVACENRRMGGFPFRLALRCDRSTFVKGKALEVQLAGLHAQSFVYRPRHQVVDFKSPARIKVGKFGTLELIWQKARLGSQLQTNGLSAATAKIENARMVLLNPPPNLANTSLIAESALISARRSAGEEPPNSVILGLISRGLAVNGSKYTLPPIALDASVLAYDIAPAFDGKKPPFPLWIEKGGEADIQGLSLVSGNAALFAKGWVKLDQNGFFNADLNVDSANLLEFVDAMGPELAQIQAISRAVIGTIQGLGENVTLNGKAAKRVKITIRKGFVSVGFIPIGTIPQIDLSRI